MMIFVTVGSVAPFDALIERVDELAGRGAICDVVCQIGDGNYIPKNTEWFRFEKGLGERYREADMVVTHNGAGTLFELLALGKKAIAVPNPGTVQVDNIDIVLKLSRDGHILLCMELDELEEFLRKAPAWEPVPYTPPKCELPELIAKYLLRTSKKK